MMVLEWREREHMYVEEVVRGDLMAQQALCACELYKFLGLKGQTKTTADASRLLGS